MECEHNWQPIPSWHARYRCTTCNAIGYRHLVLPMDVIEQKRVPEIIPYKCQGTGCKRNAIYTGWKTDKKFCQDHWESRTAKATKKRGK